TRARSATDAARSPSTPASSIASCPISLSTPGCRPRSQAWVPTTSCALASASCGADGQRRLPEHEARVAGRRHLVTLLPVLRRAAGVDDEGTRLLARHVRVDAHHPRVDPGEEHTS